MTNTSDNKLIYYFKKWVERLNATMWESAHERYLNMLQEHADIFQRVPLVYIASYRGITPESLSRLRRRKQ